MSHNVDLNSLNVRTDLAIEEVSSENANSTKVDGITVTNVVITKDNQELYNKKNGDYITIEFEDATDYNNGKKIRTLISNSNGKVSYNPDEPNKIRINTTSIEDINFFECDVYTK